jgi:predicted O-methyltransferase YrrM
MKYLKKKNVARINIIETGTARGFSALCMAKALKDSYQEGLIITFDIIPHHKKMFWNCIDDLDGQKSRAQILTPWQALIDRYILFHQGYSRLELGKVQFDRVHFAFLDGAHGYNDVMFEFTQIKDKQHSGDIIIYDDYNKNLFPGLVKAVDEICSMHSYKRVNINTGSEREYVIAIKK